MKKGILFTIMFFLLFSGLSPVFSGQKNQETKDQDSWKTYNPEGGYVGTIKKEKNRFIFYDKDEITLKEKGKKKGIRKAKQKSLKEWEMYNREGELVGILKEEKKSYRFYNNQEKYLGLILKKSKALLPKGYQKKYGAMSDGQRVYKKTAVQITPETARLYLYIVKALEQIK